MHECPSSSRQTVSFVEGVLLLGNYVNAASRSLGGAVGVALDSLAKLAHTQCLPGRQPLGLGEEPRNALHLLVRCAIEALLLDQVRVQRLHRARWRGPRGVPQDLIVPGPE